MCLKKQFISLNWLLQDSFNKAFAQIVDLSVCNSEKNLDTSMNDTTNLKEYKHKYKKLKKSYKDKIQEIKDLQNIYAKERIDLVNVIKSKEKEFTDTLNRHTKSKVQEFDSIHGMKRLIEFYRNQLFKGKKYDARKWKGASSILCKRTRGRAWTN